MILLLLAGCLGRLQEAPYVLAVDLGEARSLAFRADSALLVATPRGLYAVDGEGRAEVVDARPALAVTATRRGVYTLDGSRLRGPELDQAAPGAVDLAAGWDDRLWLLYPDHLDAVDAGDGSVSRVADGLDRARALGLTPPPTMMVVTHDSVLLVDAAGAVRPVASGLEDPRAAAMDAGGRVWVATGSPGQLFRFEAGQPVRVARYLDDPRDLHFTVIDPFPPDRLWIASGAGRVDYVAAPLGEGVAP